MNLDSWRAMGAERQLLGRNIFTLDTAETDLPCLLLIHGFPTASWDWYKLWPRLMGRFRLLSLDMLGFGFSDKPNPHRYSINEQADVVEAFLIDAGVQRCHVLAHDYGDTVAQELLARQQSAQWQCLSMCFLNGGLFPETHRALLTQKLLLSPLGPLLNRLAGKAKFESSMRSVFAPHSQPSQEELDNFWALVNHNDGKHLFHNLITYMRDRRVHRERWVTALQQSASPLALINGSLDPVSGAHMVARYQALNCRLDYVVALEVGHYPQVEDADGVFKHYMAFFESLEREAV